MTLHCKFALTKVSTWYKIIIIQLILSDIPLIYDKKE